VIGNPKAILFYMGALPGFFTLETLTPVDIALIIAISALIPMAGNLGLALFLDRARQLLSSPENLRRMNRGSGILLIGVGLAIPFV
jgi:threonine/homoserine/homoserine lactone efflux protein